MSGPHKAAIVTGASQEIGAGIIQVFFRSSRGVRITVLVRKELQ
jgi:NAD(P)-dependent dehydrogenase (short-subunit alcohol dehydrogenase family)